MTWGLGRGWGRVWKGPVASYCWALSPPREGMEADGFVQGGVSSSSLSSALRGPQAAWRPSPAIPSWREHSPGICRQETATQSPEPRTAHLSRAAGSLLCGDRLHRLGLRTLHLCP